MGTSSGARGSLNGCFLTKSARTFLKLISGPSSGQNIGGQLEILFKKSIEDLKDSNSVFHCDN